MTIDLGRVTPIYRGNYSASATYELNDIVLYTDGNLYWHTLDVPTTGVPPTQSSTWQVAFSGADQKEALDQLVAQATAAKNAAVAAETGAVSAKTAAETANTQAQTAKTQSETAKTGAEAAQTAAEAAQTAAATSASAAAASAEQIADSAARIDYVALREEEDRQILFGSIVEAAEDSYPELRSAPIHNAITIGQSVYPRMDRTRMAIDAIKGRTVAFNQLIDPANMPASLGLTLGNDGYWTGAVITVDQYSYKNLINTNDIPLDHVIYVVAEKGSTAAANFNIQRIP